MNECRLTKLTKDFADSERWTRHRSQARGWTTITTRQCRCWALAPPPGLDAGSVVVGAGQKLAEERKEQVCEQVSDFLLVRVEHKNLQIIR